MRIDSRLIHNARGVSKNSVVLPRNRQVADNLRRSRAEAEGLLGE